MTISEDQLDIWAKQGPTPQFVGTYNSIKDVLEDAKSPYHSKRKYEVHLQGSYRNDTNVYGDSDVDVVIWTSDTYHYDIDHLPTDQKALYQQNNTDVPSAGPAFKQEVLSWLNEQYGASSVIPGKKAILLKGNSHRRDADIVVCTEHRQFYRYTGNVQEDHNKGVRFFASDGTSIVNFPKLHAKACTDKHQATNSAWFKHTIRIFKNMRNRMIAMGILTEGVAPSYFIEGMLWNVPDPNFGLSYQSTVADCLNWVHNAKQSDLLCANQRRWLVRDGRPDAWPTANFNTFITEAIKFWNAGG